MRRGLLPLLLAVAVFLPYGAFAATPPPTPVPPHGSPSPFLTSLDIPHVMPGRAPARGAKAVILLDMGSGQVLYSSRPNRQLPVASLTKVMTALLTIERSKPGEMVTVSEEAAPPPDLVGVSALGLQAGERISVENLLYALLLQSAGDAAAALAEHVSGSISSFVRAMNTRAVELGASNTHFLSPSGLDDRGYSTARDIAIIATAAFEGRLFTRIVGTKFKELPGPPDGPDRYIQNRDVLLWLYPDSIGGKTGFTSKAGFCLMAVAGRGDRRSMAVLLGEPDEPFSDAAGLLTWSFDAFERSTVIEVGESFGRRQIGGSVVDVAAGQDLTLLVPRGEAPSRRAVVSESSSLGLRPGDPVGAVVVSAGGSKLGQVPLVVARVVQGEEEPPAFWWGRAVSSLFQARSTALDGTLGG